MHRSPFDQPIYYLRRKRGSDAGGTHWMFSFHDCAGALLLEARFPEIPKEAIFFEPGRAGTPLLQLKAWRCFWWNGRYDVVDGETKTVLGTIRRTGGIEGPDRRRIGTIRNAMPMGKSFIQLFCIGIISSIVGAGNDSSALPVDGFRVEANGSTIGTLRRARLPFSLDSAVMESKDQGWLRRWISRVRSRLRKKLDSGGWKLDFSDDPQNQIPPKVRLAAALFCIQIEERYR